ncbi:UDP-3-O-(3-hydroxymyristoyl) glucosamine N-acyltransferase [Rivularia sp. PCC 7116]|uniref:UDP-3-O-(3-hydroxymyristoyl)glucosamine N-acyltransferase n=1 Tax=Rivularia sp. PCC 7116 TaxID=373994 RepID=UPI00029EEA3E|nr:UDP-3-O-(3-hydroxymyristoyl)glucosamine N-acyltransferase [Rivularia sp. PCC 7116]AFY56070.1 UDP-3-O-(3-hydroxymyristoyl) glucosamine N-acyltransferase [Rivularia sp. PCC 7116]
MKFSEIVQKLGETAINSSICSLPHLDPDITTLAAIDEATTGTISYIEGAKFAGALDNTSANALILPADETLQSKAQEKGIAWIAAKEPRLLFAKTINIFYQPWQPAPGIHPSAVIHENAKIGKDVYIGAHVVIEQNVEIGNNVCIHANVVIYPDVKIGDRTVLHANCTVQERSRIGADCTINSGTVIGAEGFGFVPTKEGWFKMEQSGYTVLEDKVEIGSNSAVDRPAVGETRIGRNTVIDNLVQIGHGTKVGFGCAIAGQTATAGGVRIGNRVIIAGQSGIANQVKIGDGAIVSAKAGVHSNVPPGEIVSGNPAIPYKIYLKSNAIIQKLPEIYQYIRKLQRKFKE